MQAPTLVVVDQNSNCVYKTNNVQDYITRQRGGTIPFSDDRRMGFFILKIVSIYE